MKERTNQGGSVLVFVIVGIVLLAGLGTAVYYTVNTNKGVDSPAPILEEAATPANDQRLANGDSEESSSSSGGSSSSSTSGGGMPQSGPGDVWLSVLTMAGVSYMTFSYIYSRRELARNN